MKLKRTICMLLSAFIICGTVALSVNASELSSNTGRAVSVSQYADVNIYQSYVDEQMTKHNVSGVVLVTRNSEVICQSAKGMANTAENKEITVDTLFPIGSVSKQFCATSVLLLQEQGKLNVSDTLDKFFPEYTIGKNITVKHLLTMRSGIRDHVNPDGEYVGHVYPWEEYTLSPEATAEDNKQVIKDWLFAQELKFVSGRSFHYSNSNYFLLSEIVEQVSGVPYNDFVKQNILTPLEMVNTGFLDELANSPNLAENYLSEAVLNETSFCGLAQGAGDIISNVADMDKWLSSLKEGTILSKESFIEMTTNYSRGQYYGYGIQMTNDGGFYHSGSISTYNSMVLTYPEEGLNIIAITNNVGKFYMDIFAKDIAKFIHKYDKLGDVDRDGEVSVKDVTALQIDIAKKTQLSDEQMRYADADGDGEISVKDVTEIQLYLAKIIPAMRGESN